LEIFGFCYGNTYLQKWFIPYLQPMYVYFCVDNQPKITLKNKALSPLFVKVWRMVLLLNASTGFQRKVMTNFQTFLWTLPLMLMEMILLALVSILDPPRRYEELGVGEGIGTQVTSCQHNSSVFFIVQTIFHGMNRTKRKRLLFDVLHLVLFFIENHLQLIHDYVYSFLFIYFTFSFVFEYQDH
jgi:hypothetical protein